MITHEFVVRDPSDYSDAEAFSIALAESPTPIVFRLNRKKVEALIGDKVLSSHPFLPRDLFGCATAINGDLPAISIESIQRDLSSIIEENVKKDADRIAELRETHGLEKSWSLSVLLASEVTDKYLVDQLLVEHQPCVIAGASKSLKTTYATALALCIASGKDFLGFRTFDRRRVHFCSAESGKATAKKTILGLAEFLDIDLDELAKENMITFDWWVPRSSSMEMMDCFKTSLESSQAQVAFIDPLYLCLDDEQASQNQNGQRMQDLIKPVLQMEALPIVVDHTKLSSQNSRDRKPLELSDLSGAGKTNIFRQWLLLGKREEFTPDEDGTLHHKLWLTSGGSAGHAGRYAIDIEERNISSTERKYQISLQSYREAIEESTGHKQAAKGSKSEEQDANHKARIDMLAKQLIENIYKGDVTLSLSRNDIRERLGCKSTEAGEVIGKCINCESLTLVRLSIQKNKQHYDGYMLKGTLFSAKGKPNEDTPPTENTPTGGTPWQG